MKTAGASLQSYQGDLTLGFKADSLGFPGGPLAKNAPGDAADTRPISGPGRCPVPRGSSALEPPLLNPTRPRERTSRPRPRTEGTVINVVH